MIRFSLRTWLAAAVTGLCVASVGTLPADEIPVVGLVRISDQAPEAAAPAVAPGAGGPVAGGHVSGPVYGPVVGGYGPDVWTSGELAWSPDYGWQRPVKRPVLNRVPVQYHRYWPYRWYGEPGAFTPPLFPMVYQPTDTTQLGFYYQRVPTWLPNPRMLPPPPWPATWHRREERGFGGPIVGVAPYGGGVVVGGSPVYAGSGMAPAPAAGPGIAEPSGVPAPSATSPAAPPSATPPVPPEPRPLDRSAMTPRLMPAPR